MKTKFGFSLKELLFAYLAINKLFYWMENIAAIRADELGTVAGAIIDRLINRDFMAIVILIMMFSLDHYIETHPTLSNSNVKYLMVLIIGYVFYISSITLYSMIVNAIFAGDFITGFWVAIEMIPNMTLVYLIASIVLSVKDKMKKKEALMYLPDADSAEARIDMLNKLCSCGVISQEEYENKKELCYSTVGSD